MKKFLIIIFISFFYNSVNAADKFQGYGELTLGDPDVKWFHQYIKPPAGQSPSYFWVLAVDGEAIWSTYWYCPEGACQVGSKANSAKICKEGAEKYYKKLIIEECKIFARRRTIVWNNGINTGRGKASKAKSRFSESDLRAKLTELGFLGGKKSSNTKPKITKKKNKSSQLSDEEIKQLNELKKLFDDGILTQEEFNSAKSKILK